MRLTTKTIIAATALGTASIASAITYDAETNGTGFSGGSFSAGAYNLQVTDIDVAGVGSYLGVVGGAAGPEIGLDESLVITFDKAMRFDYITLGLLFDGPEYGDPFEIAAFDADGTEYTLTANGTSDATWTGPGTVTNLSLADSSEAAIWQINNPFGGLRVTQLTLTAVAAIGGLDQGDGESDFGLVGFGVPDNGATLALLGVALTSLAFFRRKI